MTYFTTSQRCYFRDGILTDSHVFCFIGRGGGSERQPASRVLLLHPGKAPGLCHACEHHVVSVTGGGGAKLEDACIMSLVFQKCFQLFSFSLRWRRQLWERCWMSDWKWKPLSRAKEIVYYKSHNSFDVLYTTILFVLMEEVTRRQYKMGAKPNGLYF